MYGDIPLSDILFWAEFWIKVAFTCFLIIAGIVFIKRQRTEDELKSQRYFRLGIAMFAFMASLQRIFFLITDFQVEYSDIYNIFWKLAVGASMIALIFITLVVETYFVKTKYVFSGIGVIGTILIIFVDIPLARQLNIPLYLLLGGEIFILYLYIAIKSPGILRKKSLLMLFSLLIFSVGILLDAESVMIPLFGVDLGIVGTIFMWIGLGSYLKLNY